MPTTKKRKRLKKKILSFSSSNGGKKAVSSSLSSTSLKNQQFFEESEETNVMRVLSKGTQLLLGSDKTQKMTESLEADSELYTLTNDDAYTSNVSSSVGGATKEMAKLNIKSGQNNDSLSFRQTKLNFKGKNLMNKAWTKFCNDFLPFYFKIDIKW